MKQLIELKDGDFKNTMKMNRTSQFEIVDVRTMVVGNDKKYDCVISLRRMYLYHLTNTYLPTVTLLIISEITLFFDENNLQVCPTHAFFLTTFSHVIRVAYIKN